MALLLAALALAAAPPPRPPGAPDELLRYRGRAYAAAELPSELAESTRLTASTWIPWAAEHGYRLELTDDQRVLLVLRANQKQCSEELALVAKVAALVDRIAPLPTPDEPAAEAAGEARSAPDPAPDSVPAVLLKLRNADDAASAVDLLAARNDYLASWAPAAKRAPGFVLEQPLAGAWLEQGDGLEEWSPEAELVHRCAQLLLLRRFGQQPYWLTLGLAWHAEMEIRGGVWCFPYRDEFVFATEHTDWDKALAQVFGKRDAPELTMARVASLRRGGFDREAALIAWGAARWLAEHGPAERGNGALPKLLTELRAYRDEHGREWVDDRTWVLRPGYEVPVEAQAELLARAAGADALAEIGRFFAKPRGYKRGS